MAGAPVAGPQGRHAGDQDRQADGSGRAAGGCHPRGSRAMRSPPAARRCATISAPTANSATFQHAFAVYDREGEPCPRGQGHHPPQGPVRPLDVLLSGLPALRRATMAYECITTETRDGVAIIRLDRPQALNALNAAPDRGTRPRARRLRGRRQGRRHRHHRFREGLRRRRRHQGDGGTRLCRRLSDRITPRRWSAWRAAASR